MYKIPTLLGELKVCVSIFDVKSDHSYRILCYSNVYNECSLLFALYLDGKLFILIITRTDHRWKVILTIF